MKAILSLILASILVASALGAASSSSPTTASFNQSAFTTVVTSANATATTAAPNTDTKFTDSTVYGPAVIFGAGSTNDTIFGWAVKASTTGKAYTGYVMRKLNGTIAGFGNDTVEASVIAADTVNTVTSQALVTTPVVAVGGGYLAIALVYTTSSKDSLYLLTVNGASPSAPAQTITVATAAAAATSSAATTYAVNQIWYEDGYFYILYESQAQTLNSGAVQSQLPTLYLQAYGASNGSALYTASSVATPTQIATWTAWLPAATSSNVPLTQAMGGNSNYTMSASVLIVYKDQTTATGVTKTVTVVRSTGVAGSANSLGTDASATGTVYTPGGVIGSNSTYGVTTGYQTGSSTATYNITAYYNGTTTGVNTYVTVASATANPTVVASTRYQTGYAVVYKYLTTSPSYMYEAIAYAANGTALTTTPLSLGTFQGPVSVFVDGAGQVWLGYVVYDTTSNQLASGAIARLYSSIYTQNTTTTKAANVLATFAAILTFVIASLFMF